MNRIVLTIAGLSLLAITANSSFGQAPRDTRRPTGPVNPLMRLLDADRDGVLSAEEVAGAAAKLKEFDKNKDGKLSNDELRAAVPTGRMPGRRPSSGSDYKRASASDLQKGALAKDAVEKNILAALDEMVKGPRYANVSYNDGRLLRLLAETVGAKRVVEIGTSTGESAVWLALAAKATDGHVYTHELDEGRAKVAEANFKKAGVDNVVTLVLGDAHETVKRYRDPKNPLFIDTDKGESIDILFLDADKAGYIDYMNKLMPLIRPGGLIIAHNMNTRQADLKFVKAVTEDPKLETLILLKEGTGVGVTLKKR